MCVCVCTVFASSEPVPGFQGDTLQLAFIDLRQVCQSSVQVCQTPVTPCQNYISHHLSHTHTHTHTHTDTHTHRHFRLSMFRDVVRIPGGNKIGRAHVCTPVTLESR